MTEAPFERAPWYGIGRRLFAVLKGQTYSYASRSEAEAALVLVCARDGWAFDQIRELFQRHANEKTKYREKGRDNDAYLQLTWQNALRRLEEDRRRIDKRIDSLLGAVNSSLTNPRTKWTDRTVAHAVLEIARRVGRLEHLGLSVREVAEIACVHRDTVTHSVRRIPGFAVCRRPLRRDQQSIHSPTFLHNLRGGRIGIIMNRFSHDAGRSQASGRSGLAIVEWLNQNLGRNISAKEIQQALGISQPTVSRKLRKLAPYVSSNGKTRRRRYYVFAPIGQRELDAIADRFGTLGARDRQILKHAQERSRFRLALEYWRTQDRN